jgi:hypothetical protein
MNPLGVLVNLRLQLDLLRHLPPFHSRPQEGKQRIRLKRVDVVERSLDVSNEALQQLYAALLRGEIEPKDLIGIVKGGMVGHGIGSDKLAVSEGEPTHIVQNSNINETLSKLRRFLLLVLSAESR